MNAASTLALRDYWDIAVRRKWLVVGAIVISLGIAWTLCKALPKSYRSTTLITVEEQKIPERYVTGVVSGSIQEKVSLVEQQVLSRTVLSQVIQEFKLYQDEKGTVDLDAAIRAMRSKIKVDTKGGWRVNSFSISFAHQNPLTAQQVVQRLAQQFIEENLKLREEFVEGASEFLEQELQAAKQALEIKEQAISEYKRMYIGELPGQLETNLRALDRLQKERASFQESLPKLNEQLALIEKAVSDYESSGRKTATIPGGSAAPEPAGDPLQARLLELERNLTALSTEYKDTYPDVIQTKREIARLKAQLEARPKMRHRGDETDRSIASDPYLRSLVKQRDEMRIEMTGLKDHQSRVAAEMKGIEGRVDRIPAREQELIILLRDYDNMQKNYQSLLDKKVSARIAGNLERRQKGDQFRILDPANLPTKPESPDKLKIMLAGLVLGCGVGYGGSFALELLNPSFRRPEDAEEALGCPVLAAIPDFRLAYGKGMEEKSTGTSESWQKARGGVLPLKGKLGNGKSRKDRRAARSFPRELTLVAKWSPLSVVAEQFRVAATRLASMRTEPGCTVVVMTSAVKGEGKSATTANLGYVLAQDLGKMTALIDGDLKNPTLHSYIEVPAEPGLTDLLCGHRDNRPLEHYLQRVGDLPLWVLPTGPRLDRVIELSKIQYLSVILSELRKKFEYIIVDAPPILPLADMNVLVGMADVLAMVVRAGSTPRDVVQKALKTLRPAKQIGIMLTGLWVDSVPYYLRDYYYAQQERVSRVRET